MTAGPDGIYGCFGVQKGRSMQIIWKNPGRPGMTVHDIGGTVFLTFPMLDVFPELMNCFSTRLGGVSEGIYRSMNLSYTRGDVPERVTENFRRLGKAAGFDPENMVLSDQTHTVNVRIVTKDDRGKGFTLKKDYTDVDGMITNVPGLVLATFYADCVPLFFYDPVKKAAGLSHAGWRGTVGGIGRVTVEKMQNAFGSRPEDIYAAIGPSICQDCYEVSDDVIAEVIKAYGEKDASSLYYTNERGRFQLNLWEANRLTLLKAGIREEHLSLPGICTCCNPEFLFSHRASMGKRGNLGAFLSIRQ